MKLTRQNRRILVTIFFFSAITFTGIFGNSVNASIQWLLLLLTALGFISLLIVTSAQAFRANNKLDERQLFLKLRVTESAYFLCFVIIFLEIAFSIITINPLAINLITELETERIVQWFLIMLALPTVAIAWLEPDPIPNNT